MRPGLNTKISIMRLCFFCLVVFLVGCEQAPDTPLRIAAHNWPGYEFMFLAQQEKWLDQQKVQILETKSVIESMRALKAGRIDGAALTFDEVLRLREAGVDLSVLLVFDISAGANMLIARLDVGRLEDLKDKRIGVEQGALGAVMLSQVLIRSGLDINDIERVVLTIENHKEAWQYEAVDALITVEPVASQLLAEGAKRLFDSRDIPNMIVDVLAIRKEVLKTHKIAIQHLIEKHFKALQHFQHNVQDASYRMAMHLQTVPEKVVNRYKGLLLPNIKNNFQLLAGTEPKLLENIKLLSEVMLEANILKRSSELSGLLNANFLPR